MKWTRALAGILVLGSTLVAPVAHAGGGRPPTAGTPLGSTLLRTEQAAVQRAGSFHLDGTIGILSPGASRIQLHLVADLALKPLRLHEISTARVTRLDQQPAATTIQTVEEIASGQHVALRQGTAPWQCHSLASATQMVQSLIGIPQLTSAQTMGVGTVGGTRVWLVRVLISLSLNGTPEQLPVTYAIAQSTDLPVLSQANLTMSVQGQMIHETVLFHYSHFGEPVTATLPADCP